MQSCASKTENEVRSTTDFQDFGCQGASQTRLKLEDCRDSTDQEDDVRKEDTYVGNNLTDP